MSCFSSSSLREKYQIYTNRVIESPPEGDSLWEKLSFLESCAERRELHQRSYKQISMLEKSLFWIWILTESLLHSLYACLGLSRSLERYEKNLESGSERFIVIGTAGASQIPIQASLVGQKLRLSIEDLSCDLQRKDAYLAGTLDWEKWDEKILFFTQLVVELFRRETSLNKLCMQVSGAVVDPFISGGFDTTAREGIDRIHKRIDQINMGRKRDQTLFPQDGCSVPMTISLYKSSEAFGRQTQFGFKVGEYKCPARVAWTVDSRVPKDEEDQGKKCIYWETQLEKREIEVSFKATIFPGEAFY